MVDDYERWRALLQGLPLPAAMVDLDAVDHNVNVLLSAMDQRSVPLRIASKSIRCPALIRYIQTRAGDRAAGLMTYSAHETAWLAKLGFDDLLLAYPIGRDDEATAIAKLCAQGASVWATVDHPIHVELYSRAAATLNTTVELCLDVDASLRAFGQHFGVRRSPIRQVTQALALARSIREAPGVKLTAVLSYEAQVAGLAAHHPGQRLLDPVLRAIKRRSIPMVAERRRQVVDALEADGFRLQIVNGGGTGSVRSTSQDPSVTELTAGSGFLTPHLFDHYDDLSLTPASFFALAVVRASDLNHVTCAGGGYLASGAAGVDRLPKVHVPSGFTPLSMEGFGEVQTPFKRSPTSPPLSIGDPVICRHAKSGEGFERFDEILLVRGEAVVDCVPTPRGLGVRFF